MTSSEKPTSIGPGVVLENRYRVLRPIGRGGMGEVFTSQELEEDGHLVRLVAVKVLRSDRATKMSQDCTGVSESLRHRFRLEGRIGRLLNHQNIVTVHAAGFYERTSEHYIVMELLEAIETLDERITTRFQSNSPFTLQEHKKILGPVLRATIAVHAKNILHRDIKPSNILLARQGDGEEIVKLSDFGVAKCLDDKDGATSLLSGPPACIGTPGYLAPECLKPGCRPDLRADIFSLGAVLFKMATGKNPPAATEPGYLSRASRVLRDNAASSPAGLARLILKSLEPHPEERYQSVAELLRELKVAEHLPPYELPSPSGQGGEGSSSELSFSDIGPMLAIAADECGGENGTPPLGGKPVELEAPSTQARVHEGRDTRRGRFFLLRPRDKLAVAAVLSAGLALILTGVLPRGSKEGEPVLIENAVQEPAPPEVTPADIAKDTRMGPRALQGHRHVAAQAAASEDRGSMDAASQISAPAEPPSPAGAEPAYNDAQLENTPPREQAVRQASANPAPSPTRVTGSSRSRQLAAPAPGEAFRTSRPESARPKTQSAAIKAASTERDVPPSPSAPWDEWTREPEEIGKLRVALSPALRKPRLPEPGEVLGLKPDRLYRAVLAYPLSSHSPGSVVVAILGEEINLPNARIIPKHTRLSGSAAFALRGSKQCYVDIRFDSLLLPGDAQPISIEAIATTRGRAGLSCRLDGKIDRRREGAVSEGLIDVAQELAAKVGVEAVARRILDVEREDARTLLTPQDPPASVAAMRPFELQFARYQ